MFEENSYEPIAEIYITLCDQPNQDDIYCLCSRVFIEGATGREEEVQEPEVKEDDVKEKIKTRLLEEKTVQVSNSSPDYQPVHTQKKSHQEEVVSCYCSASHYSTDEHDSLRDSSVLHHSDSGADLSESSRDHDWERYWTLHGERLIWESWIAKYGSYIDPSYLQQNTSGQTPAEGEDTSFCIQGDTAPNFYRKTSFTGVLETVKASDNKPKVESEHNSVEDIIVDDIIPPQILVENIKNDVNDLLDRRLSDISETGKSFSGKSEDSSNFDDNDRLRLSVVSRCSGSSAPLSATTDSMTNVTRITLSSSDSSYGVEDSSGKSSSVLSSSDSGSSVDHQWQNLWAEHFNEQYYFHYKKFIEKYYKKKDSEDVKSDSGFLVDDSKISIFPHGEPHHQESVDEVGSIETQDSISESEHSKPPSIAGSSKSSSKSEKSKKLSQKQRLLSVGYLLQQLNAMSVEPSERIQEEDESVKSLSRPSTMESVQNVNECPKVLEDNTFSNSADLRDDDISDKNEVSLSVRSCSEFRDCRDSSNEANITSCTQIDIRTCEDEDKCNVYGGTCNNEVDCENMQTYSGDESSNVRHGVKRCHENENNESSVEKVKSAYQLMGFMYSLEKTKKIRKASVWYKKRFSQIRFQNRILRLHRPQNKHIYFDDEGEICSQPPTVESDNQPLDENQDQIESTEYFFDAPDISSPRLEDEPHTQRKLEMEDFSEKDDSTDEDYDVFFSAEEDNFESNQEKRENKLKPIPKRRKKKQLKKKAAVNYPEIMLSNPKLKKFWHRRYALFSKYDEGIKLDEESWYSVTPEPIATVIAERCQCDLVVDAFCGAGGNAIQLAFTCERVIAVDIDPHKIELARNNARVYGVEDRIEFIVGDFVQLAPTLVADVVFMSPPWGGLSYSRWPVYPLDALLPLSGQQLYQLASNITENIVFYLPKNVNTQEVVECAGPGGCVELMQNFHDRELVAITALYGELVNTDE